MTMRRKIAAGIGGMTLLLGTLGGAVAAQTPTAPTNAAVADAETNDGNDAAVDPSRAKITVDQAKAAALAKYPGATISAAQLEDENGTLVWGIALKETSGVGQEVKVDATNGQIVAGDTNGPDGVAGDTNGPDGPEAPGSETETD